ncbi:HTTM domain-containing protein [Muriicola soli]|uniref:HTTM domain-containing protein n=1 Tax=Muriicola soli TaxID=2507538 RepID=A0A411E649_9FLAO|nr:HTTM domain-containing protein [Muriicola soli]QBA63185.1 HTTM domain-containing protein [Muriicola soli]
MLRQLLFKRVDNSALIVFRIFFGLLISFESFGAILTGWVRRTLVEPSFTFSFIDFEWLQPLPGNGMYYYFILMGVLGIFIALGYKYRGSVILFTLLWTAVYLMQKTAYNNHYYLLILISFLMCFLPAERYSSLDSKRDPTLLSTHMPAWVKWTIILQLFIVYTYAAIAKLYADWLDLSIIAILMKGKASYPLIGELLQQPYIHLGIGIVGILFDLLIVPALLWKPTRKWAFGFSIFFHLFNSIVFQIGIFPYLALAFSVFFFPPEQIRKIFFRKKAPYTAEEIRIPGYKNTLFAGLGIYFLVQLALPLRHYVIPGDVLWTEEGHRMSWRMMLRTRAGIIQFTLVDKETGESSTIPPGLFLSPGQQEKVACYPDYIWQFAQFLKKEYAQRGQNIAVYAKARVSINGRPLQPFIDSSVDLAAEEWHPFKHHNWILPSPLALDKNHSVGRP